MLRIVDVDYIKDYELLLKFSDGVVKRVDLRPYLTGDVFGELLDLDKFIQYGLTNVTIEMPNQASCNGFSLRTRKSMCLSLQNSLA